MENRGPIWARWGAGSGIALVAMCSLLVPASYAQQKTSSQTPQTPHPRATAPAQNRPAAAPGQQPSAVATQTPQGEQPAIGITFPTTNPSARVLAVMPQGPAQIAGIRPGDQIVAVNNQPTHSRVDVINAIARTMPGAPVKIRFIRNGREYHVTVYPAPRNWVFGPPPEQLSVQPQPWLGIAIQTQGWPAQGAQPGKPQAKGQTSRGLRIEGVYPGGPAAQVGLYAGEVIVKADGKNVSSNRDLEDILRQKKIGDKVDLSVLRNGQPEKVQVVLSDRRFFFPFVGQAQPWGGTAEQWTALWAIQLEQQRRAAVQRQRIEEAVDSLARQVRALRQEMDQVRTQAGSVARRPSPAGPGGPRTAERPSESYPPNSRR